MSNDKRKIKCVIWDLDNTIWNGTLLEDDDVSMNIPVVETIKKLDAHGVLNSVASKNDYSSTMKKLNQFKLNHYFLYPQISWNPKHISVIKISKLLNFSIDSFAFIDDQDFELDEVNYYLPDVMCINSKKVHEIIQMPEMIPTFITEDSKKRRQLYQTDIKRMELEKNFIGCQHDFLKTLNMELIISTATLDDLQRVEELTIRTHQLNTTGYTYSYQQLKNFINSPKYLLLIAELKDKYGSYGKIGIMLVEKHLEFWTIKLLLMSCRVIARGVGAAMISYILHLTHKYTHKLCAELIPNEKNRMMYVTYKLSGFKESEKKGELLVLEHDLKRICSNPNYLTIINKY